MKSYYKKTIQKIGLAGLGMIGCLGVSAQTQVPKNVIFNAILTRR